MATAGSRAGERANGIRDSASGTTKHGHDNHSIDVEALPCKGCKLEGRDESWEQEIGATWPSCHVRITNIIIFECWVSNLTIFSIPSPLLVFLIVNQMLPGKMARRKCRYAQ
jgi:hypothetical protein